MRNRCFSFGEKMKNISFHVHVYLCGKKSIIYNIELQVIKLKKIQHSSAVLDFLALTLSTKGSSTCHKSKLYKSTGSSGSSVLTMSSLVCKADHRKTTQSQLRKYIMLTKVVFQQFHNIKYSRCNLQKGT